MALIGNMQAGISSDEKLFLREIIWETRTGLEPQFSLLFQNCLRMVATQPIPEGHEIFNTYGQMANWQLIHMYGFVEPYPDNTDDTADIQMVTVREAAFRGKCVISPVLG